MKIELWKFQKLYIFKKKVFLQIFRVARCFTLQYCQIYRFFGPLTKKLSSPTFFEKNGFLNFLCPQDRFYKKVNHGNFDILFRGQMAPISIWPMEKSLYFLEKRKWILCHLAPKQNIKISMVYFFPKLITKLVWKFEVCSPKTVGVDRFLVSVVLWFSKFWDKWFWN